MATLWSVPQVHIGKTRVHTVHHRWEFIWCLSPSVSQRWASQTHIHKHTLCPLSRWCRAGTIKIHFAVLDTSPFHCLYWSSRVIVLIRCGIHPNTNSLCCWGVNEEIRGQSVPAPIALYEWESNFISDKIHYLYCLFYTNINTMSLCCSVQQCF